MQHIFKGSRVADSMWCGIDILDAVRTEEKNDPTPCQKCIDNLNQHGTYADKVYVSRKRDDEHMIYEVYYISQYEDGSAFDCRLGATYTAEQVARMGNTNPKWLAQDLRRNAKAALKNGTSKNLAPRV